MKKIAFLLAIVLSVPMFGVEIVPKPVSMSETSGMISLPHDISFFSSERDLTGLESVWSDVYSPIAGAKAVADPDNADVLLELDGSLASEEYSLVIGQSPDKVRISGGSRAGVWWGLQSLAQILVQCGSETGFGLPCLTVRDRPAFSYRGGMLDCARSFFPADDVKRFIDILTIHKLNVFHWHLTDDQGWRIEIRKYPRLTEIGSVRRESMDILVEDSDADDDIVFDGIPYGGYYTQEEIRDIVSYAADRQVTIIPEIEMPGHSMAALASYPELGCNEERGYEVGVEFGVYSDILCAGNPKTLEFLKGVLDEVCELFPSEYIHIGGDEAPTVRWEECPKCRARQEELGLEKAAGLHGYLLRDIEDYLNAKGRKIIGWGEILDAGVTPTATVMSWRWDGIDCARRASRMGNDVILTPLRYMYFTLHQVEGAFKTYGEPVGTAKFTTPLSMVYSYDPFSGIDDDEAVRSHIIGIQGSMWSETARTIHDIQILFNPRAGALAEDAWGSEKEDFPVFRERMRTAMVPVYEALGIEYARYGFE